jgi:hypothetical protein
MSLHETLTYLIEAGAAARSLEYLARTGAALLRTLRAWRHTRF